jgi:hypothetical protein
MPTVVLTAAAEKPVLPATAAVTVTAAEPAATAVTTPTLDTDATLGAEVP